MTAIDNARAALATMERISDGGWCLCVSSSAQGDVEAALRELIAEHERVTTVTDEMVEAAGREMYGRVDYDYERREARAIIEAALKPPVQSVQAQEEA